MEIKYVLICEMETADSITINHVIWSDHTLEDTKNEARRVALEISKLGYHRFTLIDISGSENKCVGSISVETPVAVATFKEIS